MQSGGIPDARLFGDTLLRSRAGKPVVPQTIIESDGKAVVLDLSHESDLLKGRPADSGVDWLTERIHQIMAGSGTRFAYGRYAEPRALYDNEHFAGDALGSAERRTVHMGIDVFCAAGTVIRTPRDGVVHLVTNNDRELDYGPMLVLCHDISDGKYFYTLYGHLSLTSIASTEAGQQVAAGELVAAVGRPPENGNWPPHLHFQLILDLLDLGADFPGVCRASEQDHWLALSPSPALFFPEIAPERLDYRGGRTVR
ncbi:MAG TPA: peptidoglycan DD-metalloendopeptidase family protein [Woeseiaceae bacterium]